MDYVCAATQASVATLAMVIAANLFADILGFFRIFAVLMQVVC